MLRVRAKGAIIVSVRIGVSGRIGLGIILAMVSAGAEASSSLVFPGTPAATPSVLTIKPTDAGTMRDVVSIETPGEPAVTDEKVAAIPAKPETRRDPRQGPMIIRGGIVGPAFATPTPTSAPAEAAAPTQSAAPTEGSTPASTTASAAPPADARKSSATTQDAPSPRAGQQTPSSGETK
jgi:hypothetical protein